jgi:hypothetical protein
MALAAAIWPYALAHLLYRQFWTLQFQPGVLAKIVGRQSGFAPGDLR